jgi:hypothetical protein
MATTQDAWNRYSFALNNPVTHSDPTGHSVGSWFKHELHDIENWVKKNWEQILVGMALDLVMPEGALEMDSALLDSDVAGAGGDELSAEKTSDEHGTSGDSKADQQNSISCKSASFAGGTTVATEDGLKSIETIKVGQRVWAWNKTSNNVELKMVLHTMNHIETNGLIALYTQDLLVRTTQKHPFWVESQGWVQADKLKYGNPLLTLEGQVTPLLKVVSLPGSFRVFNLVVSGANTFHVADKDDLALNKSALLVHNGCDHNEARDIRNANNHGRNRNIAIANYTDRNGNILYDEHAVSGYDSQGGIDYQSGPVQHHSWGFMSGDSHTEYQLTADFHYKVESEGFLGGDPDEVDGVLKIYTERHPCATSCQGLMRKYSTLYPKMRIDVFFGEDYDVFWGSLKNGVYTR